MDSLKTGDLLLFNNKSSGFFGFFTSLIKWGTHSNYSHVAMILKDPYFINPALKGLYVWESSFNGTPDPQDNKIKLGVQITPLHELINEYQKTGGSIFIRKVKSKCELSTNDIFNDNILRIIHNTVYDKPYDIVPKDWIEAFFKYDDTPQKTSRFWCSALVGFIYTRIGILNETTDWSVLTPNDFSLSGDSLNFTKIAELEKSEIKLI
jgi:hypothetical protein